MDCPQNPQLVEPVDTLTIWKGLRLNDCQTLIFIQGYLKVCLERLLEDQFASLRARLLSEWQSKHRATCARNEGMNIHLHHRLYFQRSQLINAVAEALDASLTETEESATDVVGRELLMLYLWSRDCLIDLQLDDSKDTAINVDFGCSFDPTAAAPPVTSVKATWIPDYISFQPLSILPHEGDDIIIKPHYCQNARQNLDGPRVHVTFSLDSTHRWLNWDARSGAFRGRVPILSRNRGPQDTAGQARPVGAQASHASVRLYSIVVKAVVVVAYPGSEVGLERTTRTRMTLQVQPAIPNAAPFPMTMPYSEYTKGFGALENPITPFAKTQYDNKIAQMSRSYAAPPLPGICNPIAPLRDMLRSSSSDTMVDANGSDFPSFIAGWHGSTMSYGLPSPKSQSDSHSDNFQNGGVRTTENKEGLKDQQDALRRVLPMRNEPDSGNNPLSPPPTRNGSDEAGAPPALAPETISNDYNEGLSPSCRRDLHALLKVHDLGQASAVFRDPVLSLEEKWQVLEAMKRSVQSRPGSRSCSGLTATSGLDSMAEEGSDWEDVPCGKEL
ncbi:MAG: hypothetical protein Q9220_004095 [cf. Caloplaca sp. 1 TL-2023]